MVRLLTVGDRLTSHGFSPVMAGFVPATSSNRSKLLDLAEFQFDGVARPKIDTATFTRERASSTSSTTPLNEANGPSDTRTCSPTSNDTAGFGRSMPSCT